MNFVAILFRVPDIAFTDGGNGLEVERGMSATNGCTPTRRAESGSDLFMRECDTVVTVLDKTLKRQLSVDGVDYMVALS